MSPLATEAEMERIVELAGLDEMRRALRAIAESLAALPNAIEEKTP